MFSLRQRHSFYGCHFSFLVLFSFCKFSPQSVCVASLLQPTAHIQAGGSIAARNCVPWYKVLYTFRYIKKFGTKFLGVKMADCRHRTVVTYKSRYRFSWCFLQTASG